MLMHNCSRVFTAVIITTSNGVRPMVIILGSAYLPYVDFEPLSSEDLDRLVMGCRAQRTHLINGCDANSHHTS
jgi:hypothetical protein